MNYQRFKQTAILGRWWQREQQTEEVQKIIKILSQGDHNLLYSLCFLWICKPESDIYKWSILDLYIASQLILIEGYTSIEQICCCLGYDWLNHYIDRVGFDFEFSKIG